MHGARGALSRLERPFDARRVETSKSGGSSSPPETGATRPDASEAAPRSTLASFALYLVVGVFSFLTDFVLYWGILWAYPAADALVANVISRPCGGLVCFFLNRHWTFENRGRARMRVQLIRFWCVFGMSLALSELLLGLVHHVLSMPAVPAKLVAEGLVVIFNYVCLRFWTFR